MTGRKVPEWIGKTPDTPIPDHVKDRVAERQGWRCAHLGIPFSAINKIEIDHIVELRDGGENRESNLQALCVIAHKAKTKAKATERAAVRRKRAKYLGLKKPKRPFPGSKASRFRKRLDGTVERRT